MKDVLKIAIAGFFILMGLAVIFVKAGNGKSGTSGGAQTAQILGSVGGIITDVGTAVS